MKLDVALKDWHAVCLAIERGRQAVMLRKGGIHETEGRFEIEHREFLLFPTWLHQKVDWIKPADREGVVVKETEPDKIELRAMARVTDIVRVKSRPQVDAVDDAHIYLSPLIDMRFNYRPENPLYLLVVRGYTLPSPITIDNTPLYAGCKSWVPLEQAIDVSDAHPTIPDADFEARRRDLLARLA